MAEQYNESGASAAQILPPGSPHVRLLKAVVIGLGILLVLSVVGLIAAAVLRAGRAPEPASAAATPTSAEPFAVSLKGKGVHVVSASIAEGKLLLHITSGAGEDVVVFDVNTGKQLGRVSVVDQTPAR